MPPPASPPPRFWSSARLALLAGAFFLPAAVLSLGAGACGDQVDETGGAGGGSGTEATSATGTGGNDADATIPDAQPDVEARSLAELCGEGPCTPGLPDTCGGGSAPRPEPGPAPEGGQPQGRPRGGLATVGCRVGADDEGEPESTCGPAGEGTSDAPCQGSADCRPGYACIPTEGSGNEAPAGICRQYCCAELESCPPDAYCAARALVDDPKLLVPVCVVLTPCELLEDGSCPLGTACSVVRESGATSCIVPGEGTLCEPCDCADGFVCAAHIGLCQRLCRTDGTGQECGTGFCQGGSDGYPTGFGVCVGGDHACE